MFVDLVGLKDGVYSHIVPANKAKPLISVWAFGRLGVWAFGRFNHIKSVKMRNISANVGKYFL